ncbi:MAG: arylesterase [Deltaproteobacteria bacterium]
MSGTGILIACLALTIAGSAPPLPALQPLQKNAVVLAFGDSLTYGTGAPPAQSYPSILEKIIARKVINAGIPGEDTRHALARLPRLLERYHPSLLILCHGANDLLQNFSELQAAENIRGMIRMAVGRGIQVVLIGVPYPGHLVSQPSFYASIAKELAIPFTRDALAKILVEPPLRSDSIHPNARGYRLLAEAIADFIQKCGAISKQTPDQKQGEPLTPT